MLNKTVMLNNQLDVKKQNLTKKIFANKIFDFRYYDDIHNVMIIKEIN